LGGRGAGAAVETLKEEEGGERRGRGKESLPKKISSMSSLDPLSHSTPWSLELSSISIN
jgi:hypothetical protein